MFPTPGIFPAPGTDHQAPAAPDVSPAIELVAVDLDGTLLGSDGRVSDVNARAIRAAVARGVRIVIATARPPRAVRAIQRSLGLSTPLIAYNGAMVVRDTRADNDPSDEREVRVDVLDHRPLDAATAWAVVDAARAALPHLAVSLEIADRWYTDRVDPRYVVESAKIESPHAVAPLQRWRGEAITKVLLLGEPADLLALHDDLLARFVGRIAIHRADAICLQVVDPAVSKGAALAQLAADMGVARDGVLAIGDAGNDIAMFDAAGVAVAMGNAWDEVKAAALARGPDRGGVVADNDRHGVAEALERFVLNPDPGATR